MSLGQMKFFSVNNRWELRLLRRQGGRGVWGCSPRLPSCQAGRAHRLWEESPAAAGQGRRKERRVFGKERELVDVMVMLHLPGALHKCAHRSFLQRFCSLVTGSQAHSDLGFLASREDPELLQAIPISRLVLKWLAEVKEKQHSFISLIFGAADSLVFF